MSREPTAPIRVVVFDAETGEQLDERFIENDYVLVAAGTCFVEHANIPQNGTHVVTVKGVGGKS